MVRVRLTALIWCCHRHCYTQPTISWCKCQPQRRYHLQQWCQCSWKLRLCALHPCWFKHLYPTLCSRLPFNHPRSLRSWRRVHWFHLMVDSLIRPPRTLSRSDPNSRRRQGEERLRLPRWWVRHLSLTTSPWCLMNSYLSNTYMFIE